AEAILSLQSNRLLNGVILRVVRKDHDPWGVIEAEKIFLARLDITQAKGDSWFDASIEILDAILHREIYVVVENFANSETERRLETPRRRGKNLHGWCGWRSFRSWQFRFCRRDLFIQSLFFGGSFSFDRRQWVGSCIFRP